MLVLKRVSLIALISATLLAPHHMAAQATGGTAAPPAQPPGQPSTPQADVKVVCVAGDEEKTNPCDKNSNRKKGPMPSEMLGHHLKLKVTNLRRATIRHGIWSCS